MKLTLKSALSPEMQAKLEAVRSSSSTSSAEKEESLEKEAPSLSMPPSKIIQQQKSTAPMKKDWKCRLEKIKAVQAWLQETWPNAFSLKEPKPLKRHIDQEILSQAGDRFSKLQIRRAIRAYTNRKVYLEAVRNSDGRYDLQGHKVEEIKENEQAYSQQTLEAKAQQFEERRAKQKQRRLKKLSRKTGGKAVDKELTVEPSPQEDS
jgi:sRNA-binding protein